MKWVFKSDRYSFVLQGLISLSKYVGYVIDSPNTVLWLKYLLLLFGSVLLSNITILLNDRHTHEASKYVSLILRHGTNFRLQRRMTQISCLVHREVYESTNGRPTGVSLWSRYVALAVFEGTFMFRSMTLNLSEISTLCKHRKEINFT